MGKTKSDLCQSYTGIDIVKLIMAFFVVAIHTEPFGAWFFLDKGFGIITRLCVPFFFVTSSYLFFSKSGNALRYIKRLFLLYFIWSIIYLPFDITLLKKMTVPEILIKYFWAGNGHALWYLCGSMVGFLIVYGLSKIMSPKKVFGISIIFLVIGCLKSTYAPVLENIFKIEIVDYLGSRNGLFYAFAYYALGLLIANKNDTYDKPGKKNIIWFVIFMILLCIESAVIVLKFNTPDTILWISVLPLTYNFFMIVKNIHIPISDNTSYFVRKCSTLIYVSHCYIMYLFPKLIYWQSFIVVAVLSTVFSVLIILLSKKHCFKWLRVLS